MHRLGDNAVLVLYFCMGVVSALLSIAVSEVLHTEVVRSMRHIPAVQFDMIEDDYAPRRSCPSGPTIDAFYRSWCQ